ncbi:MAG: hypothetical protein OYH77_01705 [Pseudomonadota bacterium]|nr:hypothetical protein [Pseudomonadota bacterium]
MNVVGQWLLVSVLLLMFASCKLERSSDISTAVTSDGQHMADVAVTPLSFSKRTLSPWEVNTRIACGDLPQPTHSRLDDLYYEITPESIYATQRFIGKGDQMMCRYQPATTQNMENTRRLFADKALALKVKYPASHGNAPPPHISFSSGMAVNITPQKYGELFIGRCIAFQNVGGINFCKTKDRLDGRTIWLVPIAPTMGSGGGVSQVNPNLIPHGKGGGTVVTQTGKGGKGSTVVTTPGKGGGTVVTTPGKGGKGGNTVVTQTGMHGGGGRIAMMIKMPHMNSPVPLSVAVPSFNFEILSILQGSGGGGELPPVLPPTDPDELYGSLLDNERISFMVIKPKGLLSEPDKAKFLKLTIKATEIKPHEGRLSGLFKTALGVPTAIVGGMLAVGASSLGMTEARKLLGGTVFASGAAMTYFGARDLKRWYDHVVELGAQKQFAVPNSDKCPALYAGNVGFTAAERYIIFKSEKQTLGWWKNIDLTYVRTNSLRANTWKVEHNEAFTIFYCRKQRTKHCVMPPADLITDRLREAIDYCSQKDIEPLGVF